MYKQKCVSLEDTKALAYKFANLVKEEGCFVNLFGEIGAGKTAFVKLVAEALGIKEKVTSPSFVILNEYHSASIPVYHFDLYRLENVGIKTITDELREYSTGRKITSLNGQNFLKANSRLRELKSMLHTMTMTAEFMSSNLSEKEIKKL